MNDSHQPAPEAAPPRGDRESAVFAAILRIGASLDLDTVLREAVDGARALGCSPIPVSCRGAPVGTPMRHRNTPVGGFYLGEKEGGFTERYEAVPVLFVQQATAIAHARVHVTSGAPGSAPTTQGWESPRSTLDCRARAGNRSLAPFSFSRRGCNGHRTTIRCSVCFRPGST